MTNADKLRNMTDNELAVWIDIVTECCSKGWVCEECPIGKIGGCDVFDIAEWLKQEAKEDDG